MFRWVWIATVVSNIGTWFQEVAAGWLMTSLSPSPLMVSLVQAATTLPLVLLGLPAGAAADILDRRKLLLATTAWMAGCAALLAGLQIAGGLGAWGLLALVFAVSLGTAMTAPAWQAIVPELVPRTHLGAAVALNGVGINIARAIGPAAAGVVIAQAGTGVAFAVNAVSFVGVGLVLWSWKSKPRDTRLPPEHFFSAIAVGVRYVRHSPAFQAVLVRSFTFAFFAVALWALLPIVTRDLLRQEASGYGVLLGFIGLGAVSGAFVLPALRKKLGPARLTAGATLVYSVALAGVGFAPSFSATCGLMMLAGLCWIAMLSTLNVSAQILLPAWVRARALSVSLITFFGAMATGAIAWGGIADAIGLSATLWAAAAGLGLASLFGIRFRLPDGEGQDLSPSKHWPEPSISTPVEGDEGPVLVVIEYEIDPSEAERFLEEADKLRILRLRDGVLSWRVYRDPDHEGRFMEAFVNATWHDHLRLHDRVTRTDREVQETLQRFHRGPNPPKVTHLISASRRRRS